MSRKIVITAICADPSIPFSPAVGNYYKVTLADGQCLSLCDDELMEQFGPYVWNSELVGKELDLSHLMPA